MDINGNVKGCIIVDINDNKELLQDILNELKDIKEILVYMNPDFKPKEKGGYPISDDAIGCTSFYK